MELLGTRLSNMKSLDGAKNTAPLKMEGTNPKVAMPMAQSSRTCVQKADSIGLRVVGCLVGAGRAVGLFFWSPITALKYLIVAAFQAYKGEGSKARKALALAVTAPLWAPMDGFYKTYRRFAMYGDDKLRDLSSNSHRVYSRIEKTWLEKIKAEAKDGVIDPQRGWLDGGARVEGGCGGCGAGCGAGCSGGCSC